MKLLGTYRINAQEVDAPEFVTTILQPFHHYLLHHFALEQILAPVSLLLHLEQLLVFPTL